MTEFNLPEYGIGIEPFVLVPLVAGFIVLLAAWSLVWKGLALWHSARRGEPWWFFALLIINTVGILEIIYLFGVAKLKFSELFSKREPHNHA